LKISSRFISVVGASYQIKIPYNKPIYLLSYLDILQQLRKLIFPSDVQGP
jgi:hypothetical protein